MSIISKLRGEKVTIVNNGNISKARILSRMERLKTSIEKQTKKESMPLLDPSTVLRDLKKSLKIYKARLALIEAEESE